MSPILVTLASDGNLSNFCNDASFNCNKFRKHVLSTFLLYKDEEENLPSLLQKPLHLAYILKN